MRHLLSSVLAPCLTMCLALLFAFQLQAQTLSSDNNNDGCVNLDDLLNVLSEYGLCSAFECGVQVPHDGYYYSTVQIGDQCWFSENCRYLPEVSPSSQGSETELNYSVYDYQGSDVEAAKETLNYLTYGVLYNWLAVMTGDICPSGWHIPSDEEFTQLTNFLGEDAGYAMKSTTGWNGSYKGTSGGGSNRSGFNGLPGGMRWRGSQFDSYPGGFEGNGYDNESYAPSGLLGVTGYWWTSTTVGRVAKRRRLFNSNDDIWQDVANKYMGHSARCVRD